MLVQILFRVWSLINEQVSPSHLFELKTSGLKILRSMWLGENFGIFSSSFLSVRVPLCICSSHLCEKLFDMKVRIRARNGKRNF